jgi:tetraacyldisaccharide 4'-kinase
VFSRSRIEDVLYGRKSSVVLEPLLAVLSVCYRAVLLLRDTGFRTGLLRSRRLPLRVLSVGNITLGGTGKTPTVIQVAGLCRDRGIRPVIVSRGYGRRDDSEILIVADGRNVLLGPDRAGDEPVMISARLGNVPVIVGRDRYRAAQLAIERFRPDCVILDDGFQHRAVKRDVDIVLIDGADPFGRGKVFPAGILREPLSALKRAHVVLITRAEQASNLEGLKRQVAAHSRALVVTGSYRPLGIVDIATDEFRPLKALQGTRVLAFAGIARPESLRGLLEKQGANVVSLRSYPDHHRFTPSDLADLVREAADARASFLITTEKDGVKLKRIAPAGIWALPVDLVIKEPQEWEKALCSGN